MKKLKIFILALIGLYLILLIPSEQKSPIKQAAGTPFIWNQDDYWAELEQSFSAAKKLKQSALDSLVSSHLNNFENYLLQLENNHFGPEDSIFTNIRQAFFTMSSLVAAHGQQTASYIDQYNQVRILTKKQSRNWDVTKLNARITLYKTLYGLRAAVEEVLLQLPDNKFDPLMLVVSEPSAAPYTDILGIRVHSGDLLLSRGGAETSALISRGNDYPGNFSHVALIYIDSETNIPYLIESHIEIGVAVATVEKYLQDSKLRIMVLRPRADLIQLTDDPLLPHKAAKTAFDEANRKHIPYDFKMDFHEPSAMFCSEVGSYAYKQQGLQLWQPVSTISSQGVVNWLTTFGVENFVTQMPSDLEYDPQLTIVAEWRDSQTLYKDHMDNAVVDALLESAENGLVIDYNPLVLPFIRVLKGYYIINNYLGFHGLIPEGMSAEQALKNNTFTMWHQELKAATEKRANQFKELNGYTPPYWQLVKMAEKAKTDLNL